MQSFLFRSLSFTGWCEQYHWGEQMEARHFFCPHRTKNAKNSPTYFRTWRKTGFALFACNTMCPGQPKPPPPWLLLFHLLGVAFFDIMRTTLKVIVALVEGKSSSLSGRGAHNHSYDNCWW